MHICQNITEILWSSHCLLPGNTWFDFYITDVHFGHLIGKDGLFQAFPIVGFSFSFIRNKYFVGKYFKVPKNIHSSSNFWLIHLFTSVWSLTFLFYLVGCDMLLILHFDVQIFPDCQIFSSNLFKLPSMSIWHLITILWTFSYFLTSDVPDLSRIEPNAFWKKLQSLRCDFGFV